MPRAALLAQLVEHLHGKEGVDGSSPSEGLQNPRSRGFSVQKDLLFVVRAVGVEPFMELSSTGLDLVRAGEEALLRSVADQARALNRRYRRPRECELVTPC